MNKQSKTDRLTLQDIFSLKQKAEAVLDALITEKGIYASTEEGWQGPYHAWFGRDSAITTDLLRAAYELGGSPKLTKKTLRGLQHLATWQGRTNNPATGEEIGKIPHEIRDSFNKVLSVQHAPGTNKDPWYIDPADHLLKNWDSCDSTPLWVIATVRTHNALELPYPPAVLDSLKLALQWCLANLQRFDGLAGFLGADLSTGRLYSGLHNQGWKDSFQVYQYENGELASHPIKDTLVNAETWAALQAGASVFANIDLDFSKTLSQAAHNLKKRFNSPVDGFLFMSKEQPFFAEALDGNNHQLRSLSADIGACLWAYGSENIFDSKYISPVVTKIMGDSFFNPQAGIRNYAIGTIAKQGTNYHRSSHTYWPFISALTIHGLEKFGYHSEAQAVAVAMLQAIKQLHSNLELFIEANNHLSPWKHPSLGQQSATNQAWTAAGVYYASLFLLHSRFTK